MEEEEGDCENQQQEKENDTDQFRSKYAQQAANGLAGRAKQTCQTIPESFVPKKVPREICNSVAR